MGMLGDCRGSTWQLDDLSPCFLADYLETLLPLISCGLSVLALASQSIQHAVDARRHRKRKVQLVDVGEEDGATVAADNVEDLTLQISKTQTHQTRREVDRPTRKILLLSLELVAIFGNSILSVVSIFTGYQGHHGNAVLREIAVAQTIVWSYVALLAITRFLSSTSRLQISWLKLWNHTAVLYFVQWCLQLMVFRSVLIHPRVWIAQTFPIVQFSLTSLLLATILVSRKGNKEVVLPCEDGIEPSQEPLASVLSLVSFAWVDPIVWRGYKKTLELTDVWNITLSDQAASVIAEFRQIKKTHALALRLLLFFKRKLLIQGAWAMVASVFMFLPTLLLKAILEYLEDPTSTPRNAAWLYVILLFVTGAVQAIADGQGLWIGRRICIRLRAIIIGELYSKTLRRKAAASTESESGKEERKDPKALSKRVLSFGRKKKSDMKNDDEPSPARAPDTQTNNGTIINLMSIDSFKVADIAAYLHFLWAATPVQLAMAIALLYRILGLSSFAGIGLMVLILPMNLYIAKSFQAAQKKIMAATDVRIHSTNEVLQNIRIIKYFAWEERFFNNVNENRRVELRALRRKYILWSSAATIWSAVPILITFISFLIYTLVEKKPLIPSIAFPALSMFALLRIPLDQLADMVAHVQESKVSVDRVEEFLNEEETEKYTQLRRSRQSQRADTQIALRNATLTWGSQAGSGGDAHTAFRLLNIEAEFAIGKLNIIAGPTGSGKTSLLMALLGEMKLLDGLVQIPGGSVRQDLAADPETGLTESVAYCAQQAWLVNDTIRENILFASPHDRGRYQEVLRACALQRDLDILDAGDQTLVGEKGIALSGGQKQRISLARAMYSNSKHLLLDDCLSAVDSHTAKHIFESAIMGELMEKRTCVLVTHNTSLTVPRASFVLVLDNGKVAAQGSPEYVISSGALGDELLKSRPVSRGTSAAVSRVASNLEEEMTKMSNNHSQTNGHAEASIRKPSKSDQNAFVDTRVESKASGSVKAATIKMYLLSMGPWYFWVFAGFGFVATQLGSVATNVWIRQWANAYTTRGVITAPNPVNDVHRLAPFRSLVSSGSGFMKMPYLWDSTTVSTFTANPYDVDVAYYLGVYALLGLVFVSITFGRELLLFWGSLHASWQLHERLLDGVLRAKFKFFDSTPLGQLMNRFSKDVQSIDQEVAPVAIGMFHSAFSVVTIVILIAIVTPGFLVAGFFISLMYIATGLFYIRSSRDLKRIEAVQRSPLFQHFGETLSGVVTIRAYGDEARFILDSHRKVNTHNRPFLSLWAVNRWLAFRVDIAGAFVACFSAVFVVLNVDTIDAGAAGLALSYAITFTENVLWLVRLYAANEQNMNAVERVQEYIEVEQEASAKIPETQPAANWPSHGAVQFIAYTTRYRPDLDPVLRNLTFTIEAGEKVGIVGRTGAGKSSLALALFRGLEAERGKIVIDDVDIGLIGLQDLRENITLVPQDSTLFTGTLRSNLDPFGVYTDEEIFTALRRVQLLSSSNKMKADGTGTSTPEAPSDAMTPTPGSTPKHTADAVDSSTGAMSSQATLVRFLSNTHDNKNVFHDLSSPIAESGSNLSQGQRQLICLARALIKSPKVLIMDEATASIDYATDSKIQETLRELKNNTIITIAHRLQTIVDYDKVLVLDQGELVEYANPWELLQKEDGVFRSMCEISGDFETLQQLAKKAWQDRRLVDYS